MAYEKVYNMSFGKVYPLLVNKAVKKGRTAEEVQSAYHLADRVFGRRRLNRLRYRTSAMEIFSGRRRK